MWLERSPAGGPPRRGVGGSPRWPGQWLQALVGQERTLSHSIGKPLQSFKYERGVI